ncbi:hypothetical protein CEXT_332901 [Caerostris extrusa]|uniref:Uncharacterized protein n=1 Tax=Caerostris extrusa TaxID=172846 RepID=A0AAV4PI57_CAEEX|nr:hypothetical protein CEXT_332901 [Caerostris extrusa]
MIADSSNLYSDIDEVLSLSTAISYEDSADFDDDRNSNVRYSFGPGGFYIPLEKKTNSKFLVEEMPLNEILQEKELVKESSNLLLDDNKS